MYEADSAHHSQTLQDKLRALYGLRGGPAIDLTIRPAYIELLRRLGDPHENLPPVIHVAGTNGKGSTIAFLRAMFEAAGFRVHSYTSPHLLRFNERIILTGHEITDAALETLLEEVTAVNDGLPLTFFEVTTAMAFLAFARIKADILLLETGLGGRLDCTNIVANPLATIITPIGMDHREYLGDTIEKIAGEKAGIIKPGVPCVVAAQDHEAALDVLDARAQEMGSPVIVAARAHADVKLALPGAHQLTNAGAALACLDLMPPDLRIDDNARARGLAAARWPARLQKLAPRADLPGWEIWLDGGHNAPAALALAEWAAQDARPLHLIIGMMKTKDAENFIAPLAPHIVSLRAVPIPGEDLAADPADLAAIAARHGVKARVCADLADALKPDFGPPGRILVAGSLYLAGHALAVLS